MVDGFLSSLADRLWRGYADAVLGEDLVLVLGQQDRMMRGGDTWENPVSYDKMAVRYRRWRNEVSGKVGADESAKGAFGMDSGELFRLDDTATL